ncbi:hypothetical protein F5X68DRAFT_55742 [Plectosphaerella plurivora]|uniref:Uncharacterized protein n=1 Tax=Plectosphaerella plurivora TaxID=936078 RepID=A0A9P8V2Z6_9PEZI|nr:hypothetical protein F5X68DRAFT_55742 [Plectosphaerella plurivora]
MDRALALYRPLVATEPPPTDRATWLAGTVRRSSLPPVNLAHTPLLGAHSFPLVRRAATNLPERSNHERAPAPPAEETRFPSLPPAFALLNSLVVAAARATTSLSSFHSLRSSPPALSSIRLPADVRVACFSTGKSVDTQNRLFWALRLEPLLVPGFRIRHLPRPRIHGTAAQRNETHLPGRLLNPDAPSSTACFGPRAP